MDESPLELGDHYLEVSQAIGMELLGALDSACRALQLDYLIFAGTLLGAVRHGDWIPWDDDIDVVMLRDDFERFRVACQPHLPDHIRFSDARSDPAHVTAIPRLLHLGTQRADVGRARVSVPPEGRHVCLDIFVLDRAPAADPLGQWLWRRRIRLLEKLVIARQTRLRQVLTHHSASPMRKAVEACGVLVAATASARTWRMRHLRACTAHAASGSGLLSDSNSFKPTFRRVLFLDEEILPTRPLRFGGMRVPGPQDPHAVLRKLYGPRYLEPPPAGERVPLHFRAGLVTEPSEGQARMRPETDDG